MGSVVPFRLRVSRETVSVVQSSSAIAAFYATRAGLFEYVSTNWHMLTGMSQQSACGNGWLDVIHPARRHYVSAKWREAVSGEAFLFVDFPLASAGKGHVLFQALPQYDRRHRFLGHSGTLTPVCLLRSLQFLPPSLGNEMASASDTALV